MSDFWDSNSPFDGRLKTFWVSFFEKENRIGLFVCDGPMWITGIAGGWNPEVDDERLTVCVAVRARSETEAKAAVVLAYSDQSGPLEWRFCEECDEDWEPLAQERFEAKPEMRWPWP